MWSRLSFTGLAVLLFAGGAAAQQVDPPGPGPTPTIYVCSADAYVVRVEGNKVDKIAKGSGAFDDCVFGPDGFLYISNGNKIVNVNVGAFNKQTLTPGSVVTLPTNVQARGLAFNGNTLYINTAANGVYKFPLGGAATVFAAGGAGEGHGVAVTIKGDIAAAYVDTSSTLQRTLYKYPNPQDPSAGYQLPPSPVALLGARPFGIAVNTCGDIVVADSASGSIFQVKKDATVSDSSLITFATGVPVNVEVDSSNRQYILVADDETGLNPRLVIASPTGAAASNTSSGGQSWINTCDSATGTAGPDLKLKQAVGIAIGPSAHTLSWTRNSNGHVFDFGYYQIEFGFALSSSNTTSVMASRTLPGLVKFSNAFPAGTHPRAISPLGGLATEWVFKTSDASTLGTFTVGYSYFSNDEPLGKIGVARSPNDTLAPGGTYQTNVQDDFWGIGDFDDRSGERGDVYSKRVLFNSPAQCVIQSFGQPFNSQNPLFNGPQNISITLQSTCGNKATIRVSVARIFDDRPPETQTVSATNSGPGNIMTAQGGGRYKFNLDSTLLDTSGATPAKPAQFVVTFNGDVAPYNVYFTFSKSQ